MDEKSVARIRSEEMEHSQIMRTLHMLTDRYGPRVTGTPNHEAAAKWAVAQMTQWGMKNAHLEPWEFGHPGWLNERAAGFVTAPVKQNLKFEVLAWTPSTKGTVTGPAIQVEPPQGPLPPAADAAGATRLPAGARRARIRTAAPGTDEGRDGQMGGGDAVQAVRQDGAGGQGGGDPGQLQRAAEAPAGRPGERAVRSGQSECRTGGRGQFGGGGGRGGAAIRIPTG